MPQKDSLFIHLRKIPQVLLPSGAVRDECDQGGYKCSQTSNNASAAPAAEENTVETPKAPLEATVIVASNVSGSKKKKKKLPDDKRLCASLDCSVIKINNKKKNITGRRLLKNQSGAELQSGGNQEVSYAAGSSSGYEAVVRE